VRVRTRVRSIWAFGHVCTCAGLGTGVCVRARVGTCAGDIP